MKLMKKYLSNQRGVTLIELLAVIVILGILAAVAVPVVLNQIDDADDKADAANLALINDAVERYAVINEKYPAGDLDDLKAELLSDKFTGSNGASNKNNGGPFLKTFPLPQQTGKTWSYSSTTGKVTSN